MIKLIRGIPTANGFMPLGFPLLSITMPGYKITWSNYHKQVGANLGSLRSRGSRSKSILR